MLVFCAPISRLGNTDRHLQTLTLFHLFISAGDRRQLFLMADKETLCSLIHLTEVAGARNFFSSTVQDH